MDCLSLSEVNIPDGCKSIDALAFMGCESLTSVYIPSSVEMIGEDVFDGCKNLCELIVDSNNKNYCSEDGLLYDYNKTKLIFVPKQICGNVNIPEGVTEIKIMPLKLV